jgi:hypothetical protein
MLATHSCDPNSSFSLSTKSMLESYITEWNAYASKWKALESQAPDRVLIISYETWLQNPQKVTHVLCQRLSQQVNSPVCICLMQTFGKLQEGSFQHIPQSEKSSFAKARKFYLGCEYLSWYDESALRFLTAFRDQSLYSWLDITECQS